jgi:predicted nuclease with TOPRIM domain
LAEAESRATGDVPFSANGSTSACPPTGATLPPDRAVSVEYYEAEIARLHKERNDARRERDALVPLSEDADATKTILDLRASLALVEAQNHKVRSSRDAMASQLEEYADRIRALHWENVDSNEALKKLRLKYDDALTIIVDLTAALKEKD